jgi:hypothetical protein
MVGQVYFNRFWQNVISLQLIDASCYDLWLYIIAATFTLFFKFLHANVTRKFRNIDIYIFKDITWILSIFALMRSRWYRWDEWQGVDRYWQTTFENKGEWNIIRRISPVCSQRRLRLVTRRPYEICTVKSGTGVSPLCDSFDLSLSMLHGDVDMWEQPDRFKDLATRTVVNFDWVLSWEVILCSSKLLIKYDGARIKINFRSNE